MVNTSRKLIIILSLILAYSCEPGNPIGSVPQKENELVIKSIFRPDKDKQCLIITSTNYFNAGYKYLDYDSVNIRILINDSTIYVKPSSSEVDQLYRRYWFNKMISAGEKYTIICSHIDYKTVYGSFTVPSPVDFIRPDTIINIQEFSDNIIFKWRGQKNTFGYYTKIYLYGSDNNNYFRLQLNDEQNHDFQHLSLPTPTKNNEYKLDKEKLIKCLKSASSIDCVKLTDNYEIYLYARVYSLSVGAFMQASELNPDQLSSFNSKVNKYSNIENGEGIVGSYWITSSPTIIINKKFINSIKN